MKANPAKYAPGASDKVVSGAVEGTDCAAVVAAIDKYGTGECDGPAEDGDPCKRRLGHRNEPKGESGKG